MRIAVVYDAVYPYVTGGAERRYYEIGRRLAERGHELHFVSWTWWDGEATRFDGERWLHGAGRPPALHDGGGKRTFGAALAFALRSAPALARLDVDVVECSSIPYASTFTTAAVAAMRRRPLIVSWHEYMGERWREYAGRRAFAASRIEALSARCGDLRVSVSPFTSRRLPRGPRTIVVPNGVDCEAARRARRLAASDVVAAGRLVAHKRFDLLLCALVHAPGVTAGIIGEGPERARLERLAAELGVTERVRFFGRVADEREVYGLFKGARTVLSASEQEGFGMTVVEAMAAGTPSVVVRCAHSAAAEIVTHEVDGLVVEADAESIAAAIERIVGDGALRARLGRAARASAQAYDWERATDRFEDACNALAGGARVVRPRAAEVVA